MTLRIPSIVPFALALGLGGCGGVGLEDGGSRADSARVSEGAGSSIAPGTLTAGAWDDNENYALFESYRAERAAMGGTLPLTAGEHDAAHARFSERSARATLDIALVIDTTGSMGDEMSYLQTEFAAIARAIDDRFPEADQRWALVVYRDAGDDYLVEQSDFTSSTRDFGATLGARPAGGGGDYPEAPDAAFAAANELDWRHDADTARLVFWVADAPHHERKAAAFAAALRQTAELDIHVYPVASSGVDPLTELTMRSAAQLTGGRYLFLTDDSGVGLSHREPTIPCYFVTALNHAILRMIHIELTGRYAEPRPEQIIRTGGDPESGACRLDDGTDVLIF